MGHAVWPTRVTSRLTGRHWNRGGPGGGRDLVTAGVVTGYPGRRTVAEIVTAAVPSGVAVARYSSADRCPVV